MHSRLTLRMDKDLIQQAKDHAKKEGKSLSQTVAEYFLSLSDQMDDHNAVPPITQSLIGIVDAKTIREEDFKQHLLEKYL